MPVKVSDRSRGVLQFQAQLQNILPLACFGDCGVLKIGSEPVEGVDFKPQYVVVG